MEAAGKIHYLADTKVVPSCTSSDYKLTKARAVDQFKVGKGSTLTEKSYDVTGIWAASCSRCMSGQCKPRGTVGKVLTAHYVAIYCVVYKEVNRTTTENDTVLR